MTTVTPELMQAMSAMMASAIQASIANLGTEANGSSSTTKPRLPLFAISEYRSTEHTLVADYFKRFEWSLELSKISSDLHANYARVHMGSELNNALKFLINPRSPEDLTYEELKQVLISHFDRAKNKYAESIRFRHITQQSGETIANFALRLRQGAAHCEYGEFLDRMLTEQLLHGLAVREMCDEIVAKKPTTFAEAYDIANALEATRKTTNEVKESSSTTQDTTHKLGYGQPKLKHNGKPSRQRSSSRGRRQQPNHQDSSRQQKDYVCHGCGGKHARSQCRFRDAVCHTCNKKGHLSKVCKSKELNTDTRTVAALQPAEHVDTIRYRDKINAVNSRQKCMIDVEIDGKILRMELDSGAPCGIVNVKTLRTIKPKFLLKKTDRQFVSYTGHQIPCIGRTLVNVTIGKTTQKLKLFVVKGHFDALFGREWISHFIHEIDFAKLFSATETINMISSVNPKLTHAQKERLGQLLAKYKDVFNLKAGTLTGPPISLHRKPGTTPIFAKAREIPIALRDAYAREIDSKIESGFYKKVEYSEWLSTTHVVAKKNGQLRITGNYKPTVNPRVVIDEHPIPKVEHIFSHFKEAQIFCHLDVSDAYSHLVLDEESSHMLTLNTPTHGLIRPTRAVYGAASIPAIWQRRMEIVIEGLRNVKNFYDDFIIFAEDFESLLRVLDEVLERFREHGLHLNREKCVFATSSIEFLGHKVDSQGIHKSDRHIEAIQKISKPSTPEELQLFLGKASYYSSFIPDLSTRDRPLRDMLLSKLFKWTSVAEKAFEDIKNILISPQVLMPYDPKRPLLLATDASKTGLGAVLSHRLSNGQERPIAYASRTMSATEQRYPQIDKEALAIVWAVQKFFYYLYARHFTIITDHKPLTQILHPEKSLPTLCISRMANYADYLSHFDFDVIFKPTEENTNADYCSRIPIPVFTSTTHRISLKEREEIEYDGFDHFVLHQIEQLPVNAERIARETRKDPHLGKIVQRLEAGQDLSRFGYKAPEIHYRLGSNCLVFEHRVVIPPTLREAILSELHTAHIGIVKMKGLARSFVFWPGIDSKIEEVAKACVNCSINAHDPTRYRSHHWEYPKGPWERVHIDYAGPVAGKMLLIIVDAYSKWLEVKATNSTTTQATISIMEELFATYGVPVTIVSDNGPQFTSMEFKLFLQKSGVKFHKFIAPYHPASNGQAERYVQTVKNAMKTMATTPGSLQHNLNEFLCQYRRAPHATTNQSPAQLFLGRTIRTKLDLVRPDETNVKITQKQQAVANPTFREFQPTQKIYFLSGNPRMDKWIPGTIVTRLGDLHYEIDYQGKRFKRHVDQMRSRWEDNHHRGSSQNQGANGDSPRRIHFYENSKTQRAVSPTPSLDDSSDSSSDSYVSVSSGNSSFNPPQQQVNQPSPELRRSTRIRRAPQRFIPR
ncbi:PREDICTED: uncharacterized protein K02A2.6-like [Vollenhovia emeryi]|uniref:uncharacterized protein K02A2.6-like n=1 Tax=Vollenhovia emeryi TaxID=411798 RepID=UPI0005F371CA|nr:PREDICTED: uncharacterized protein K02A2.6-like [Vollenhovia emeryi]